MSEKRNLLISFSGGETSGYMTRRLLASNEVRAAYGRIAVIFANTGQEDERCLQFVARCDAEFGFGTVWIEAVTHPGRRLACTSRVVDFATASRDGAPFEAMVRKYGLPNSKFSHCTRELKERPIGHYAREVLGWPTGTYDTAIGVRADEFDRVSPTARERGLVYPLVTKWPTTKPQVNAWWAAQPFRLGMKGYQGNCRWCWKKTLTKHLTLMHESPEIYDFPEYLELHYSLIGPEFAKGTVPGYRRTMFRDNRTVKDLRQQLAQALESGTYQPARDDAAWVDPAEDGREGGCAEACEVFA